jgi:hypothetical protein
MDAQSLSPRSFPRSCFTVLALMLLSRGGVQGSTVPSLHTEVRGPVHNLKVSSGLLVSGRMTEWWARITIIFEAGSCAICHGAWLCLGSLIGVFISPHSPFVLSQKPRSDTSCLVLCPTGKDSSAHRWPGPLALSAFVPHPHAVCSM